MSQNITLNELALFSQSEQKMWGEIKKNITTSTNKIQINPIEYSKVVSIRKSKMIGNIDLILN